MRKEKRAMEKIEIGYAPCFEATLDNSERSFSAKALAETMRFLSLIREFCGSEPEKARLLVEQVLLDDCYIVPTVICEFDNSDQIATEYALWVRDNCPLYWDGRGARRYIAPVTATP